MEKISNQITEISGGWQLRLSDPAFPEAIPATVPGCIHTDLIALGLIEDISVTGKESDQSWIWKTDSSYSTTLLQDRRNLQSELIFHGLDTLASIYINGELRLQTKNMHRSYRLLITRDLRAGDVALEIKFSAPLPDAQEQERKLGVYPRPYEMPYNYQRKMACSYGWDWGPTTITSGIWKKVELHQWRRSYLKNFSILASLMGKTGLLSIDSQIGGEDITKVKVEIGSGGQVITSETIDYAQHIKFNLPDVELWQPSGRGEQKLYSVTFSLLFGETVIESQTKQIGFRTVQLDTSEISDGKHLFALKVNGERLWIRGANWIPDDPFPSRMSKERYQQRITDALDANINCLRVWGGGIYESEEFYEICDVAGIVVWQDFLFACAAYPQTPELILEIRAEATEAVERLRSHASLIMWCGGNESLEGFQHWGWPEQLQGKAWGELYYRTLLPKIVEELDSTRPYIPGSPFSTHNEDVKSFNSGTNHIWDVWNDLGYERYEEYSPAFCAEFGYSGPGSYSMLSQSIGKPLLDSKDTDLAIHQKALNGMAKLAAGLQREFRNPPTAGIPWYFATALVQARAVEVGLKHFRSNYETCSGTILWQFNDMWPAISWSALDHTGFRKLAWHAMQGAYKPRSIFIGRIDHGGKFTILNDSNEPWIGSAVVTLMNSSGIIQLEVTIAISLDPYSLHRELLADHFPQILFNDFDGFLHARVNDLSTARRTILAPAWKAPWHDLTITSELVAESLIVTITANTYIHELCLLPELISIGTNVDSQLISLLPGETHTFIILGLPGSLKEIQDSLADIVWSHNRIVNEKYIN